MRTVCKTIHMKYKVMFLKVKHNLVSVKYESFWKALPTLLKHQATYLKYRIRE